MLPRIEAPTRKDKSTQGNQIHKIIGGSEQGKDCESNITIMGDVWEGVGGGGRDYNRFL